MDLSTPIRINKTSIVITEYCTLKCKLCIPFIPYTHNPRHLTLHDAELLLKNFFSMVDSVQILTLSGGEPLMNKDLLPIMKHIIEVYADRILTSIDLVSNGTLPFPEEILDFLASHRDKFKVTMSNYGPSLSTKIEENAHALLQKAIPLHMLNFSSGKLHYDGWIDFRDQSEKQSDISKRDLHSSSCMMHQRKLFTIRNGELHSCSLSYFRMHAGIIPKNPTEYINLLDSSFHSEEQKSTLISMLTQKSSASCAYCVGFKGNAIRVTPAEQLTREEIENYPYCIYNETF